ncbi:MAG: flagellar export chaperone FliS [Desulfatiglandales bacterium]
MLANQNLKNYRQSDIATSTSEDIVVALYDGAIEFLTKARDCMLTGDILGKHNNINRCRDILLELNDSLNMEIGGEIASSLRRLYLFMARYILQCSWRNDVSGMDKIRGMLLDLRGAWATCRDIVKKGKTQEEDKEKRVAISC